MEILKVTGSDKKILLNLLQAYEAEFSQITKKMPNQDGLYPLDVSLDGSYDSYILYLENTPSGFVVKGTDDHHHDIAEFYVVPAKRGCHVGRKFAQEIFSRYKGKWQVKQVDGADKAVVFWQKTISEFTNDNYTEESIHDPYWGKITRQRFESK